MFTFRPRRALSSLASLMLVIGAVAAPAAVSAATADRYLDTRVRLEDSRITTASGTIAFLLDVRHDQPGMSFSFWPAGSDPEFDPPLLVQGDPADLSVSVDGWTMRASVPLDWAEAGAGSGSAGAAVIVADLAATGERVLIDEREQNGNRRTHRAGWEQAVVATGSVTLPGGATFPFNGVDGSLGLVETFWSNPDARTDRARYSDIAAAVELDDAVVVVTGQLGEYWGWVQVARLPFDPDQTPAIGGYYIADVDPMAFSLAIPVFSFDDVPMGDATLDIRYAEVGRPTTLWTDMQHAKLKTVEQPLAVHGSVTFPGVAPVDLAGLEATFIDQQLIWPAPDGGRPEGAAPVNDLPDHALDLAVGDEVRNVWTGGAAAEGEVAFPGTIAHTVWYRLHGTGGPILLDTAASDYDTAMIVYQVVEGEPIEIASADDTAPGRTPAGADFQASLVLDTEAGVEYLVQVGSAGTAYRDAPAEFGRLFMTVVPAG